LIIICTSAIFLFFLGWSLYLSYETFSILIIIFGIKFLKDLDKIKEAKIAASESATLLNLEEKNKAILTKIIFRNFKLALIGLGLSVFYVMIEWPCIHDAHSEKCFDTFLTLMLAGGIPLLILLGIFGLSFFGIFSNPLTLYRGFRQKNSSKEKAISLVSLIISILVFVITIIYMKWENRG